MRVLMLVPYPGIHGPLPKIVPVLAHSLRDLGCVVDTAPWSRHAEHESLGDKLIGRVQDLLRILARLAGGRYDVLFISTAHTWAGLARDLPLVLLTRFVCPHRVIEFHGSDAHLLSSRHHRLFRALSRLLVRNCDAVLLLSEQEREQWAAFERRTRFDVVLNPFVSTQARSTGHDASLPIRSDAGESNARPFTILFVGRLMTEKGIFDLLDAMRRLVAHADCRLVILGDGPAADVVRRRITLLGLEEKVDLPGYLAGDRLRAVYEEADVFALPTYWAEGFPTVILEAMDAGLPVVTTPLRGAADRLEEGVNVLFVPARRPDLLADALERLLMDTDLRAAMGRQNRRKVAEFLPERVAPKYLSVLLSVVGSGKDCDSRAAGAREGS